MEGTSYPWGLRLRAGQALPFSRRGPTWSDHKGWGQADVGPTLLELDRLALECWSDLGPACWARGASSPLPPAVVPLPLPLPEALELFLTQLSCFCRRWTEPLAGEWRWRQERAKRLPSSPNPSPGLGFLRGLVVPDLGGKATFHHTNKIPRRPHRYTRSQTQEHTRGPTYGAQEPDRNAHRDSGHNLGTYRRVSTQLSLET